LRTNIDIDDKLMKQAMKATGATTKKGAVEAALRQTVQIKAQGAIRKLRGKVVWRGPDDDWFASDEEIQKKHRDANQAAASNTLKRVEPIEQRELVGNQGHR
jgi:Arc/MetJ family transcription regulator